MVLLEIAITRNEIIILKKPLKKLLMQNISPLSSRPHCSALYSLNALAPELFSKYQYVLLNKQYSGFKYNSSRYRK